MLTRVLIVSAGLFLRKSGPASMGSGSQFGSEKSSICTCARGWTGSSTSANESPLSLSPTRLATMHRMVSGRPLFGGLRYVKWTLGFKGYLKYLRIGSATLCRRTPGGSINRRQRMIDTYCARMSFVSAPGCSNLRELLKWKLSDAFRKSQFNPYAFRSA